MAAPSALGPRHRSAASARSEPADSSTGTICELVHTLNVGGAEILAERFARALGGPQHVVFACLDELGTLGTQLVEEGYAVEVLHRKSGIDLGCARRLARFIRQQRVALVHAHQYTPFFYAALSRRVGWGGPPILFTEHGRFYPDHPNRKRRLLSPWLLGRADRVVAVGECVKTALAANDGVPPNRIEVVFNGVDPNRFGSASRPRDEIRGQLGLAPDNVALLFVARLDPIKDHATAISAIDRVRQSVPNVKLLIVGDGSERPNIERRIADARLDGVVQLLGMRRDIPDLLSAADIFILTSVSEGIPLTVIEAMAAGLPVIGTRVGGMPEVVLDDVTGTLAASGDFDGIAAAVARLARDPSLRKAWGERGRIRVREAFDESTMIERYLRLRDAMTAKPTIHRT